MIATDQVNFGEDMLSLKKCREILDIWHWIAIRYSNIIQMPVVSTRVPTTYRFWSNM